MREGTRGSDPREYGEDLELAVLEPEETKTLLISLASVERILRDQGRAMPGCFMWKYTARPRGGA